MMSGYQAKKSLIIVGMHRSHSSLVASAFHSAGLFLGEDLIAANESNIHGHYESEQIVEFHQKMITQFHLRNRWQLIDRKKALQAANSSEFQDQALPLIKEHFFKPCFGWKDPRVAFFLTGWHKVLPDPKYLIIVRHPADVIASLVRRSLSYATIKYRPFLATRYFNLWDNTYMAVLSFFKEHAPEHHCLLVPDDLLDSEAVNKLNQQLKIWNIPINDVDFNGVIDHSLLSSPTASQYCHLVYRMRSSTKRIYRTLRELSGK